MKAMDENDNTLQNANHSGCRHNYFHCLHILTELPCPVCNPIITYLPVVRLTTQIAKQPAITRYCLMCSACHEVRLGGRRSH